MGLDVFTPGFGREFEVGQVAVAFLGIGETEVQVELECAGIGHGLQGEAACVATGPTFQDGELD